MESIQVFDFDPKHLNRLRRPLAISPHFHLLFKLNETHDFFKFQHTTYSRRRTPDN